MVVTEEMKKLRVWLTENHVPWTDVSSRSEYWICRTHFKIGKNDWSVIHGYGSYGGIDFLSDEDNGLLELMARPVNNGEPVGHLTADRVIEYIVNKVRE